MWYGWAALGVVLAAWHPSPSLAATQAEWRARSIYALLTDRFARTDGSTTAPCKTAERLYCGGTWRGLIDHLDYIQGMGFSAIYISPVTKQIPQVTGDGAAYHGYWQQDIYGLNPNFGSADDLRALASALHSRDMYLMVDVVANHMAFAGPGNSVDYSAFVPFTSSMYYHPYCPITDDNNQTNTEVCWLGDNVVSLPDLDTTRADVKGIMYDWIKSLVANYSIDGLRIDAARHVQKDFWPEFNQSAGVFSTGEVFDRNASFVCSYQQVLDGVLNYPIHFALVEAFHSPTGNFSQLVDTINAVRSDCKNTTLMGTFLENHDNPRLPSYTNDLALDKNGIAFTILWDGIPMIYAGEEQHFNGSSDPSNREALWLSGYPTASELYKFVALTNQLRNLAVKQDAAYPAYLSSIIHSDNHTLALRKGSDGFQVITVLTNVGSSSSGTPPHHLVLSGTGIPPGEQLTDIYTCAVTAVDPSRNLSLTMEGGLPKVLYPSLKLKGSGICGQ